MPCCNGRCLAASFLFLLVFNLAALNICYSGQVYDSGLELIYIESNVGGASGGHMALKINKNVYHFQQFADGYFRLKRDRWNHFRLIYNDLENRSLFVAETPCPSRMTDSIEGRFTRILLGQERNFENLAALRKDMELFDSMKYGTGYLDVEGAGLFSAHETDVSPYMAHLKEDALSVLGQTYLADQLACVERNMKNLAPSSLSSISLPGARVDIPPLITTYSTKLQELISLKLALTWLRGERAANRGILVDAGPLEPCVHEKLRDFAASIRKSATGLLASSRPDRGRALLVQMIRYQAVMQSLETGRLVITDPFPDDTGEVSRTALMGDLETLQLLIQDAESRLARAKKNICSTKNMDEFSYNVLENMAARWAEITKSRYEGTPLRISENIEIPSRGKKIGIRCFKGAAPDIRHLVQQARKDHDLYAAKLKRIYSYNLITSNCVTELVRELKKAFLDEGTMTQAFTAGLDPGPAAAFVPFRFFDHWVSHMNVLRVENLPSYRKRMLAGMYRHENPLRVYLRECNTMTSSIYRPDHVDSSFLLFTDDTVLPRPVFGAVNTAYSALTAASGLFTLPFDRARRIKQGFWGIIYSMPELFFANIRKGSFTWTARHTEN
ncbi:MAG TPA: hypothetical protein EYP57_03295 [Thermodesulfobacteriaceae bacterium]|nr:hypothetical protein [Thermodesulfobacteriaceae bacterium]